jgi:hypothetical protein
MQIPVVVESVGSGHFRAYVSSPFQAIGEGKTQDEAVSKVHEQLQNEIKAGKQIVMVDVPAKEENPWMAIAGSLKDNPLLEEWKEAMEEFRHQCDIEAGIDLSDRQ